VIFKVLYRHIPIWVKVLLNFNQSANQ